MAKRCQHSGGDEAAAAYVRRELDVIEKFTKKTGYMPFRIERGGGIEHKRTTYEDFLTPAANWAMAKARASALWKENPGKALAAQIPEAVEMIPRVPFEHESERKAMRIDDALYIQKMTKQSINYALKAFDRVAENGGDDVAFAEAMAERLLRYAKNRRAPRAAGNEGEEGLQNCHPSDDAPEAGRVTNLSPFEPESVEDTGEVISKLDAALIYAARGWRVVPCAEHGKKPLIIEWQKRAATNEKTIREWWRKWPDANIGIATGAASGFVVLDIDPKNGGDASLTELLEQHGELPPTMRAGTGGGGQHLLFLHPGVTIKNSISSLGEGLDIRGDGGFIVAPPSLHESGRMYEWLNVTKPAPLPEWLLKRLTQEKPIPLSAAARNLHPQAESGATGEGLIIEGGRNDFLFRRVASWRAGKGESYEEIEAAVFEANAQQCSPPLDAIECQKIARSAFMLETRKRAGAGACADVRV